MGHLASGLSETADQRGIKTSSQFRQDKGIHRKLSRTGGGIGRAFKKRPLPPNTPDDPLLLKGLQTHGGLCCDTPRTWLPAHSLLWNGSAVDKRPDDTSSRRCCAHDPTCLSYGGWMSMATCIVTNSSAPHDALLQFHEIWKCLFHVMR